MVVLFNFIYYKDVKTARAEIKKAERLEKRAEKALNRVKKEAKNRNKVD